MKLRAFIDWLRRRRAERLERDVEAEAERHREQQAFDPSQGELRPHDSSGSFLP